MLRIFAAVLLGMLAAVAAMLVLELIGMQLFPLPSAALQDETDLAQAVAQASTGKLLWVLAGWGIASFCGGWVAGRIAAVRRTMAGIAIGVLVVAGVVLNVTALPHPLWMTIAGLLLPLPLAWLGARLSGSRASTPAHA